MNEIELAWVAGWLEGEGCFQFNKSVAITAASTDLDVLQKVQSIIGGFINKRKMKKAHWKDAWDLTVKKTDQLIKIIPLLLPHLGQRRTVAAKKTLERALATKKKMDFKSAEIMRKRLQAKELRKEGLTHQNIADKLGVERSYITHLLRGDYDN